MLTPLENRVAVVTGGSRGIGRGIATALARHGARVLIAARGEEEAAATAAAISGDGGVARHAVADLSLPEGAEELARAAREAFGGVDILCCNAGVFPNVPLREMTPADLDLVLQTNLRGTMLAVRACLPDLERSGRGRVVLTSSITGPITGYPGWSHYGASKAGQLGFMRTAAIELAPSGITVNAVLPGNVVTEGLDDVGAAYQEQMARSIPLRRLGTVEEVAAAVLFLASEEAGYVTGQTIVVDGGQTLPESPEAL